MGIEKTKLLADESLYWPGINSDIEIPLKLWEVAGANMLTQ